MEQNSSKGDSGRSDGLSHTAPPADSESSCAGVAIDAFDTIHEADASVILSFHEGHRMVEVTGSVPSATEGLGSGPITVGSDPEVESIDRLVEYYTANGDQSRCEILSRLVKMTVNRDDGAKREMIERLCESAAQTDPELLREAVERVD